jgi:hypothetical protein
MCFLDILVGRREAFQQHTSYPSHTQRLVVNLLRTYCYHSVLSQYLLRELLLQLRCEKGEIIEGLGTAGKRTGFAQPVLNVRKLHGHRVSFKRFECSISRKPVSIVAFDCIDALLGSSTFLIRNFLF